MLGKLLTYSGIITKVKSMEGHLINIDEYKKIAEFDSIAEFIAFLKTEPTYSHIFANVDETNIHRGQIESKFIYSLYNDYANIYRFANIKQRKILSLIFFRYEVGILKSCLQLVFNKDKNYDLSMFEEFFNKHSKLNIKSLAESETIEEFESKLKGTKYYNLFHLMKNANQKTMFDYEMELDVYYFKTIWKLKNNYLKHDELAAFTDISGKKIDLLNILWIYRSKKYYNISVGQIYSYIIPINYKLTKIQLNSLIESTSIDDFITILLTTYYHKMYSDLDQSSIELLYTKMLNKLHSVSKRRYSSSIAPVNAYLFLKEQEIDYLTTALECIRYGLEPAETMKYVLL